MSGPIVLDAHGRHAQAVRFTEQPPRLVSAGQDAMVRLWSVPDFRPLGAFAGHSKSVNSVSLTPDESRLATASSDHTVRVWSFPDGACRYVLEQQAAARIDPKGRWLATVSTGGKIGLWELETGRERAVLEVPDRRALSLAFGPAGGELLVGGTGRIHRLSLPDGQPLGALEGHAETVGCLRLSPRGRRLLSTGGDATLRVWSTADWSPLASIPLKTGGVFRIAVTGPHDVAAVSVDRGILLVSLALGEIAERIELPVKGVYGVAYSSDGRHLACAAADGKVRVWAL